MIDDPYGGKKPGCLRWPSAGLLAVLALLVLMFGILG